MWWNKDWMKENKDMFKNLAKMRRWGGLRYVVLYSLSEVAKNGAEIMDEVERMSMGAWRPSPGSIYPLLNTLQEEMLIRKRDDQRYELTSAGMEEIGYSSHRHDHHHGSRSLEGTLDEIDSYVSYLEDLPRDRLKPAESRLAYIADRLQKLRESLKNGT
ncbi:MAG: Transcriptional regulator PadR-like family protein [Methanocella sp. PtaU1.Bin125]|nr:MAG: Transcriptional regulator PadR-like family protein [Methanocella sp. PtaU1.Bin125]